MSNLPAFAREIWSKDVPTGFGDRQWMWLITIDGAEHDALLLAEDAMTDWTVGLERMGLVGYHPNGWKFLTSPPVQAS